MVSDKLITKIKTILHNLRVSGEAISRKTVIAIDNGVLGSRCPEKLTKNVGSVTLSTKWPRRMGSRNPKVPRLGEKTWHDSKDGNEPGIV